MATLKDDSSSKAQKAREELKTLESQRTKMEAKIRSLLNTIPEEFRDVSQPPRYKDDENFPRADVDIWTINGVRKEVITLQNDHKAVMKQIETKLFEVFKNNKPTTTTTTTTDTNNTTTNISANTSASTITTTPTTVQRQDSDKVDKTEVTKTTAIEELESSQPKRISPWSLKPFMLVKSVMEDSPAAESGLKTGDIIVQFGTITHNNYSTELLQSIVTSSVDKAIPVVVRRNPEGIFELNLVPKRWNGMGLLGCHLVPNKE